jgi:hypothetical protein
LPTNHLLQCQGDNWTVENLTFDMGGLYSIGDRLFGYFLARQQLASGKLRNNQKREVGNHCFRRQELGYRKELY